MKTPILITWLLTISALGVYAIDAGNGVDLMIASGDSESLPVLDSDTPLIYDAGAVDVSDAIAFPPTPEQEAIAILQSQEERFIALKEMSLSDAIIYLARVAGMNFVAPPTEAFSEMVNLRVTGNPYSVLKLLGDSYAFECEPFLSTGGQVVWRFYKVNINELVTRTYKLKYNNQRVADITTPALSSQALPGGVSGGTAASAGQPSNISNAITMNDEELTKTIEAVLATPTTGLAATFQTADRHGNFVRLRMPGFDASKQWARSDNLPKGWVKFVPDTNSLLVAATRQQHDLIAQYLQSTDRPQPAVEVAVQFVEIAHQPGSDWGVDWSGVSGVNVGASNLNSQIDLNQFSAGNWPSQALFSSSDISVALNFLKTNTNAYILQSPTLLASNNRPVSLSATINLPVRSGNTSVATGSGSTTSDTISYLQVGTITNVRAQVMEGSVMDTDRRSVHLAVAISISSQNGTQVIDGSEYPIVASRQFAYEVVVPDGYTLAVSGLMEDITRDTEKKVPGLGSIPIVGRAFKSNSTAQNRANLLCFITPRILDTANNRLTIAQAPTVVTPEQAQLAVSQRVDPVTGIADQGKADKTEAAAMLPQQQSYERGRSIGESKSPRRY